MLYNVEASNKPAPTVKNAIVAIATMLNIFSIIKSLDNTIHHAFPFALHNHQDIHHLS